jgi:DNA polymerase III sliding clamp (beta) subunit (PCNA family)
VVPVRAGGGSGKDKEVAVLKIFTLNKDLLRLLALPAAVSASRTGLPISENILLKTTGSTLSAEAFSLDTHCRESVVTEPEDEGCVTVPAKLLVNTALKAAPHYESCILEETDGCRLSYKAGDFQAEIMGLPADEFPSPGLENELPQLEFGLFLDAADKVLHSTSPQGFVNSFYVGGVCLEWRDGKISLLSTDNSRMNTALACEEAPEGCLGETNRALVSRESLALLRALAKKCRGPLRFGLSKDSTRLIASFQTVKGEEEELVAETIMSARLMAGRFPNFADAVDLKSYEHTAIVHKEWLLGVAGRLATVLPPKHTTIWLEFRDGRLHCEAKSVERGWAKESMDARQSGPNVRFGLCFQHLTQTLETLKSDRVVFRIRDERSPVVIEGGQDPGYVGAIAVVEQLEER